MPVLLLKEIMFGVRYLFIVIILLNILILKEGSITWTGMLK